MDEILFKSFKKNYMGGLYADPPEHKQEIWDRLDRLHEEAKKLFILSSFNDIYYLL